MDFTFLIKLQFKGTKAMGVKIAKLKKEIDALHKDLSAMQNLERDQTKEKQELALKAKKILLEEQIPALLQDISSIANKHNVKIMQIKPSKEAKAKDEKGSITEKLTPILITLDLMCGYHNLGSFLNDLGNSEQVILVQEMKIMSNPSDCFQQKVDLALKTYVKQ
jgi:Tfp pilus assembly protein PilO